MKHFIEHTDLNTGKTKKEYLDIAETLYKTPTANFVIFKAIDENGKEFVLKATTDENYNTTYTSNEFE